MIDFIMSAIYCVAVLFVGISSLNQDDSEIVAFGKFTLCLVAVTAVYSSFETVRHLLFDGWAPHTERHFINAVAFGAIAFLYRAGVREAVSPAIERVKSWF